MGFDKYILYYIILKKLLSVTNSRNGYDRLKSQIVIPVEKECEKCHEHLKVYFL